MNKKILLQCYLQYTPVTPPFGTATLPPQQHILHHHHTSAIRPLPIIPPSPHPSLPPPSSLDRPTV